MTTTNEAKTFPVSLSIEAHMIAKNCCQGITNSQKAKQIYLNTLAIYAVEVYLSCMGFETDWKNSDSRDPFMLKFTNVADLDIKPIGKLECLPLLPEDDVLRIPPEVQEDRIGYIAVRLVPSLKEATVLGFTQKASDQILLERLHSLDELLVYLTGLEESKLTKSATSQVNISEWIQGIFSEGWQAIDNVLGINNPAWGFARSGVRKNSELGSDKQSLYEPVEAAKVFDFGLLSNRQSLALIIKSKPTENQEADVRVRVCPMGEFEYLPPGLKMKVTLNLDEPPENSQEVTAREKDNLIQLEFSESPGRKFKVELSLGNIVIIEEFFV